MKSLRSSITALVALVASLLSLQAQEIVVTVTPVQNVLPPQAMLYVTNPSDYFNVILSNTGATDENVYLVMQIEQYYPASGLAVSTPAERQPKLPIIVPAGGSRQLAPAEIKGLFNHIPLSEVSAPENLFNNYFNGSFSLLPEGDYVAHLTAYRWHSEPATPFVVSSPEGGAAYFKVCYLAQPPRFLTPQAGNGLDLETLEVAELDPQLAQFTWQAPTVNCNPAAASPFTYDFRVVELMPNQMPDEVMDGQNVVYQITNLMSPVVTIPQTIVKTLNKEHVFAAQVTANSANRDSRMLNYVSIVNGGKSTYRLFRFKQEQKGEETTDDSTDEGKDKEGDKDNEDQEETDDDPDEWEFYMGEVLYKDSLNNDSLYTFRVPRITEPYFFKMDGARKKYVEGNIDVAWDAVRFMGGEGLESDTIQFAYKVQLFNNGERANKEEAVEKGLLVYESAEMTDLKDEIEWVKIQEQVEAGDYMVLRILPIVKHGHSVAFSGDENIVDFGLSKRASKQYFQCSDMVEIENKTATSKTAADLKGKEVGIGEYQLTIDEISGTASEGFKGKGRVAWEPFGSKIMICVQFDKLRINTDDIVYEGDCVTYAAPEMKNAEFLDELFSDMGLDNVIADTELPYADKLQSETDKKLANLAERYNIKDYYDEVTTGKNIYSLITTGEVDNVHLPVKMPSELKNLSPVDIQIASMKFTPSNAQMNIVGETVLPKTDYLGNEILLFGAPRLCISPSRFLPESGHLALLGDFTVNDPNSDFTITFKAPKNLQEPEDGCYVSWHDDEFEDLGLDVDMVIPDLRKDENGKATEECPKLHAQMRIGGWDDFIIDDVTMDPFQHLDIPGYTFTAKNIVVDFSDHRNSASMGSFPDKYSRDEAGCKERDELWHGLYIGDISVQFPSSLSIGENGERLKIDGEHMFFDKSGCTLTFGVDSILPPQTTGKMGGWGISLDHANLTIIQNKFENCHFDGRLDIPLFDKVDEKKKDEFGEVAYDCTIRRLTDPRKNARGERLEKMRYAYIFNTHEIDDLNFNFVVADVTLDKRQTYFLLEAEDNAVTDSIDTRVELCLGGDISIGGSEEVNDALKAITDELPLELKMPGIHFTKMRISNVARDKWVSTDATVLALHNAREEAEKEVKAIAVLSEAKEHELADGKCFLNMGEWSLASAQKKIGPFNFKINDYKFDFESDDISLYINGGLELCEIVDVSAGVTISSKLQKPEKLYDIGGYSLSDGKVKFNDIELGVEVAGVMTFEGTLKIIDDGTKKGYDGSITVDVNELFKLNCDGGYYEHKGLTEDEEKEKKSAAEQKAQDELKANPASKVTWEDYYDDDPSYSWGYFRVNMESSAGLRFDPIVINRISGGFYFNCRPTLGGDKEKDKFGGTPEEHFGNIGVALGLGMSTTAGEETLRADVDLMVAYDRQAHCLSTFLFNGTLKAVGGIVDANVTLTYQNEKVKTSANGQTSYTSKNRYLCLNVTCEGGIDSKALIEKVTGANEHLASIQEKLKDFQGAMDKVDIKEVVVNPEQSMNKLSGDYEKNPDGVAADNDDSEGDVAKKEGEAKDGPDITAGKFKVTLEFKITWAENGKTNTPPKWHLYLGEPAKDKRCTFTYLKFKSTICTVDIGADAYLCVGNELPDNGALPAIPTKIIEFLNGEKTDGVDMGADLTKVERSRAKAAKALLDPTSLKGGVMVGASCWGDIDINLGLINGSIESLAGFDASLVHYGNNAVCMNNFSTMGRDGWYAMGQLYAYLAAKLGVHIKIGHLIDEKVSLINAGIGGVLEMGLPNPTWLEGQLRVKMSFLGGLFKLNKKFEFAAGNHCVPFVGNALDGFEMFQEVSLGSDSLYEALCKPEFAISASDVSKMTFTTNTSLGSHYRLVDPSYLPEIAESAGTGEADSLFNIYASRTYVFDMDQNLNANNMKMGVRLFDLGDFSGEGLSDMSEDEFYKYLGAKKWDDVLKPQGRSGQTLVGDGLYGTFIQYLASCAQTRENTVCETSWAMSGRSRSNGRKSSAPLHRSETGSFDEVIESNNLYKNSSFGYKALKNPYKQEVDVSFREDKGTFFHLSNMKVQPGHCYALVLKADAYEIDNGERVWAQYVNTDGNRNDAEYIQWRQSKLWFFRVKTDAEDGVNSDNIKDLTPYVALAYPSVDGTKVKSGSEGYTTAYIKDIMHPTIALNRKVFNTDDKAKMKWVLTAYKASEHSDENPNVWHETQTRDAKFIDSLNCFNIEPATPFNRISKFTAEASKSGYDFSDELYHLQLTYTYHHVQYTDATQMKVESEKDSTRCLVDLWLTAAPHDVTISGMSGKQDDSWQSTTDHFVTGEILPYSLPFVGTRPSAAPELLYEPFVDSNGKEKFDDEDIVFDNVKLNNIPYRLVDPYLYLAYLSKWTFIGDRAIGKYSFDDAYIPFASESLVFERNGTVVNSDFIKDEESKSLWQLRTDMYNTWNDWFYNNPEGNVEWPLPSTAKTAGGLTIANQDGKTSSLTPVNLHHFKDNSSNFIDLIDDYAAVYEVAKELSDRLYSEAHTMFSYFLWCWEWKNNDFKSASFNDERFNRLMKDYNSMHRGQYLEVSKRGVTVRVPYYQLPLIFGGCFSSEGYPWPTYLGHDLNYSQRGFASSIGAKELNSNLMKRNEVRWSIYPSNLLFYRLLGKEPVKSFTENYDATPPLVFGRYSSQYANSYVNAYGTDNDRQVERDVFDIKTSLKNVKGFKAKAYRVDSYDMTTGEYKMTKRGGGPWIDDFEIGVGERYSDLAEAYSSGAEIINTVKTHYDHKMPQALMSRTDKDLILKLVYSDLMYKPNNYYDGLYVTAVSAGDDFMSDANRFNGHYFDAKSVVIDRSFADADIRSTSRWFQGFNNLTKIEGLKYLNTSKVTDMSMMFAGDYSLESLDLSHFDTQNVTNAEYMFLSCERLGTLTHNFVMPKLTNMGGMFSHCKNLKTIDISNVLGSKAENTMMLFECCSALNTLHMDNLAPENVKRFQMMFTEVADNVTIYYAFDLDKRIRDQFPKGATLKIGANPYKAVHVLTATGAEYLIFLRDSKEIKTGNKYDFNVNGVKYVGATVKNVWSGEEVTNTGANPGWSSVANKISQVLIDKTFNAAVKATGQWFAGFTNATRIEGLAHLNTSESTDMSKMFYGCEKVEELDVAGFQTRNVENMSNMFRGCKALKAIDVSRFNHVKVKNMSGMFRDCESLADIQLFHNIYEGMMDFNWELALPLEDVSYMFENCKSLRQLQIGRAFDTRNAINMRYMFRNCSELEHIDNSYGSLRTDNAQDLSYMFYGCRSLQELNLSQFKTTNVNNTAYMFGACSSLQKLVVDNMTFESIVGNNEMFTAVPTNCYIEMLATTYEGTKNFSTMLPKSKYVNLKLVYPAKVLVVEDGSTKKLVFLVSNTEYASGGTWNGYKVAGVYSGMDKLQTHPWTGSWNYRTTVTSVVFDPSFAQVRPTTTADWFKNMSNLTKVEGLQYLNTSEVTSMSSMFYMCKNLESLPSLNTWNTVKVLNMANMFFSCESLTALDVSKFNTSAVENMNAMFSQCSKLTQIDVSQWDVSHVMNMENMFSYCKGLESLDLSAWDVSNVTFMSAMFGENIKLKTLKLSDWDVSNVYNMNGMFWNCSALTELDLSGWNTKSLGIMAHMFHGCSSLTSLTFGKGLNLDKLNSGMNENVFLNVRDVAVELPFINQSALRETFINKLGFIEGDTGWFVMDNEENPEEPDNVAQAIWTEDNSTLTFYYGPQRKAGGTFGGRSVTAVWSGTDVTNAASMWLSGTNYSPWGAEIHDKATTVVFDASFAEVKPAKTAYWFVGFSKLKRIDGIRYLDTSESNSMYCMFNGCSALETIDVSGFNTSNVTSVAFMFGGCSNLTALDLSGFDTRSVTSAGAMFSGDSNLKELKVGANFSFDKITSKVSNAFSNVTDLRVTVVPKSATSTIKDVFVNKLGFVVGTTGRIPISDTKYAQAIWTKGNGTMTFLFDVQYNAGEQYKGQTITNVWISNAATSNASTWTAEVKDYLTKVVIDDSYSVVPVHSTAGWFWDCTKLTSIQGLKNLHTSNTSSMFRNTGFVDINISDLDTKNVTMMNAMFHSCVSLKTAICNVSTDKLTNMYQMFCNCSSLTRVDLSSFKTWKVTNMSQVFYGCTSLTRLYLGDSFSTANVTMNTNCFYKVTPGNLMIFWRGDYFYKSATESVYDSYWMTRREQLKRLGLSGFSEVKDSRSDTNIL